MNAEITIRRQDGSIVWTNTIPAIEKGTSFVCDLGPERYLMEGDYLFKGFSFESSGLLMPPLTFTEIDG